MKLVHFADLHLDTAFAGFDLDVARRRRQALRDTLVRILALADEENADALLCAGDLYEADRFTPDTREFIRSNLGATHRRVFVAPGNHDPWGPRSLFAQVEWPANVTVFTGDRLFPAELDGGLTLWGAGFQGPTRSEGFLDDGFRVDRGGVNLALFHGSERFGLPGLVGSQSPHAPFDASQIVAAGLDHAFVGHYHQPKDGDHYTYPGNPDPLSFGETGQRGAVVIEIADDGSITRQRRVVAISQVHDLDLDVTGSVSSQDVRDCAANALEGLEGVARLTLTGELGSDVDLDLKGLCQLSHNLDAAPLVRARGLTYGYDFKKIAQEPTVRGRFVQDVLAASELGEEERRRVLVTGLRALDGRDDLEVA